MVIFYMYFFTKNFTSWFLSQNSPKKSLHESYFLIFVFVETLQRCCEGKTCHRESALVRTYRKSEKKPLSLNTKPLDKMWRKKWSVVDLFGDKSFYKQSTNYNQNFEYLPSRFLNIVKFWPKFWRCEWK